MKIPDLTLANTELTNLYHSRCAVCWSASYAHIHELIPRSQLSEWWYTVNRIPICATCHTAEHTEGRVSDRQPLIREKADRLLTNLGVKDIPSEMTRIDSLIQEE